MDEVRETLRFIRLAETRKDLAEFGEEKLLQLNEMLDEFVARRLELKGAERMLHKRIVQGVSTDAEAEELLAELTRTKRAFHESELEMVAEARKILTPRETITFLRFYERFQREVQRRVRQLQRQKRPGNRRFRN
jgi:hypothetical protein